MTMCVLESYRQLSDTDRMREELNNLQRWLFTVQSGDATNDLFDRMVRSVQVITEIVQSEESNADGFYRIGGFEILSELLSAPNENLQVSSAELVAHLAQNNTYCQKQLMRGNIGRNIMKLLEADKSDPVCVKALYALSCLCRDNVDVVRILRELKAIPVLINMIQKSDENLQTKAAFLLASVVKERKICDIVYRAGLGKVLVKLLNDKESISHEHILSILVTMAEQVKKVKELYLSDVEMKQLLLEKLAFYEGKEEYLESHEYVQTLLKYYD